MRIHLEERAARLKGWLGSTGMFAVLAVSVVGCRSPARGYWVKIAKPAPCSEEIPRGELVRVLQHGLVRLESKDMPLQELDRQLEEVFRKRVQRVVLVVGDGSLSFGEVIEVVDLAARHADYVSLVTPVVEREASQRTGVCIDPNIHIQNVLM